MMRVSMVSRKTIAAVALFIGALASAVAHAAAPIIPAPPQLAASAYILIDADTNAVLVENNSEQRL
ncbi:MAG: serine-type D-Ala-D-Ala carboxypeptidase, partial [Pseudomonadales bacterium]|nr:serine-type D-Ala-D-Ala carboxypeptidase [Pseudomonadales bacterium]